MGVLGRSTVPRDIGSRARGQVHSAWQWKLSLIGTEEIATSRRSAAEAAGRPDSENPLALGRANSDDLSKRAWARESRSDESVSGPDGRLGPGGKRRHSPLQWPL